MTRRSGSNRGRIRVGIVGAGNMATIHIEAWRAAGAEVIGIHAPDVKSATVLAETANTRVIEDRHEIVTAVDVLDVCAPTHVHREYVIAAARAGRHVVCEKPLALTPAEAEDCAKASASAGVRLLLGHVVRFFPEYAAALRTGSPPRVTVPAPPTRRTVNPLAW